MYQKGVINRSKFKIPVFILLSWLLSSKTSSTSNQILSRSLNPLNLYSKEDKYLLWIKQSF